MGQIFSAILMPNPLQANEKDVAHFNHE